MIITQDKETGLWKATPKGEAIYPTALQAKNAWRDNKLNEIRASLQKVRNKR